MTPPDDPDLEPTEAELREAEALARALDDGHAHAHLPADAWQVAALLRSDHAVPAPVIDQVTLARRRRTRRSLWSGVIGLAASVVLAVGLTRGGADLPHPSAALLAAQARAPAGARPLEREMREHRRALLHALDRHYRGDP